MMDEINLESQDPNLSRTMKIDTNMYGLAPSFKGLIKFDINKINDILSDPLLTSENIELLLGETIDFENNEDLKYIPTENSNIRIAMIYLAFKTKIPLLIVGPTSSAKTFGIIVAFNIYYQKQLKKDKTIELKLLRLNVSEETSREDFLGTIVFDENKGQYIFKDGPFTEAYEKGYWLLIDELTLAPYQALQAIEAALDSKHLTVQKLGKIEEINMHKDFFLACTTNPNNKFYQRSNLPIEFKDRFLCINFENLSNDEMLHILKEKCSEKVAEDEIQKIINAHYVHAINDEKSDFNMFTLRDLDKARFLLDRGLKSDQIIDIIYHTRSGEDFISYTNNNENPFESINGFIFTENRKKYWKIILDCLINGYNVILESSHNEGTSDFAEAIAKIYNKNKTPIIISMTNEFHVSYFTEFLVPYHSNEQFEIKYIKGVMYKAMEEGRVLIINNLEKGKTKVIEALNDIYECNLLDEKSYKINRGFKIDPNFRIIFTMHSSAINSLSAAFFNRFIHFKMKPTKEIYNHFNVKDGLPINIYGTVFPEVPDVTSNVEYLCQSKKIAHTSQIEAFYALTMISDEKQIPLCISSDVGYGINIGMHLYLDEKYGRSKVHDYYCTNEQSVENLIGHYAFEGELVFKIGELLQAAINGEVMIFHGIDKLNLDSFSCIEAILYYLKDETREFIIPGYDVSKYKPSKNFRCFATIDNDDYNDIEHISKYFHILPIQSKDANINDIRKQFPKPTRNDYLKLCQLNNKGEDEDFYENYSELLDNLITCFLLCYEKKNIFDTSYRMFCRMINCIEKLCLPESPIEQAISIFALFQNLNENTINELLTILNQELKFNYTKVEELLKSDIKVLENQLEKGLLSIPLSYITLYNEKIPIKEMSKGQLDAIFRLIGIEAPKILVGQNFYRENLLKDLTYQNISVYNVIKDTTYNDIIGGMSFKKNHQQSGEYGHGEIFDLLIGYMKLFPSMKDKIASIKDLHSNKALTDISLIIEETNDEGLKPYFQYLYDIIMKESQYATFFELGFVVRELLLNNTILIKNVDELNDSIIDSLIPFLDNTIDLKNCLPGDFDHLNQVRINNPSIYFACSDEKYNNLPVAFSSRVQAIHIHKLTKDDLRLYTDDINLVNVYDSLIKDYTDINRAINVIKIASVLNNYKTPEERITIAYKILTQDQTLFKYEEKLYKIEELIDYNEKTKEIISKRTGASFKINIKDDTIDVKEKIYEKLKELIYVPSLAFLVDLTIISLATHIPLIIVSSPGQGKSTFIRIFGEAIDKKVECINMSKSKTSEEFQGQIAPSEDGFDYKIGSLYKELEKDKIYLIDEFNLASEELLSFFLTIFNAPYGSYINHPYTMKKYEKKLNFIATMNPEKFSSGRIQLPTGFTSCSIMYKMDDYTEFDITSIIVKKFYKYSTVFEEYEKSLKFIGECHKMAMKKSNDATIRDILKLDEMLQSYNMLNKKISNKKIASYAEKVYSSKMIDCLDKFNEICEQYSKKTKKIPDNVIKGQYILKKQIKTILKKTNRVLYIKGASGCGKNKVMYDLADNEFDGNMHTVFTIQLCSESEESEFLGRYEPKYSEKNEILDEFIKDLKSAKRDSSSNYETALSNYLDDLQNSDNVIETIEKIKKIPEIMENEKIKKKIISFEKDWKHNISFDYIESLLVKAMRSGHWVILDNINQCSGDILESLNSFLEEKHILSLPNGDSYSYESKDKTITPIKKGFKLILISNDQINNEENHVVSGPFESRCIIIRANKPDNQDLAKIGSNIFSTSYYSDFMSKLFFEDSISHVRDMIRLAKVCKFFNQNEKLTIEEKLGKSIKFILNNNYNMPDDFSISKNNGINIYKFLISTIQTNLIDNKLEDRFFVINRYDSILEEIQKIIQSLGESDNLSELFKETLRLACYVFSTMPFPIKGDYYIIHEKLITFLLCGHRITSNPKKKVPDFVWNLTFLPAVWDLVFVAKNKYDTFTTIDGFKEFINLYSYESDEFECEFYNYFNKNVKAFSDKMEEEIDEQINALFKRDIIERKNDPLLNPNKNQIELEKLPLTFPSIPNNKIVLNNISYSNAIELLDWLNITPSINMLKILGINLEEKLVFKEYESVFKDTMDLQHSHIYNKLLTKYDQSFRIFKEIFDLQENDETLKSSISKICEKYPDIKIGYLGNLNSKFQNFCKKKRNECDITEIILNILLKADIKIKKAFNQGRTINKMPDIKIQNYLKASSILETINDNYIKEQIKKLMENSFIDNDKMKEIIKLGNIDKHITNNDTEYLSKYSEYLLPYNKNIQDLNDIVLSIIVAKFIIPANCYCFQISNNLYKKLRQTLTISQIDNLLEEIKENLNDDNVNFSFLENLLRQLKFQPISMKKLNDREIISNIISDMNLYNVEYVITRDLSKAKKYNQLMSKKCLEHLSKKQIKIHKKKDDDDDDINEEEDEDVLKFIIGLLESESAGISEDVSDETSLNYEIEDEDNCIAKFAHFLTDCEIKKFQIEKKEILSFKINGENYKSIPIESLILNLVYLSIYTKIENSLANEFNFIDQMLQVSNPKTAYEIVQKDIILYLSNINKDDIDEKEKQLIKDNVDKILSSEKLDINSLSLNIVYNTEYRKRKIQYDNIMSEYTKIMIKIGQISKMIDNIIVQIENNFKYLIKTKTINEIEENRSTIDIINKLASQILKPSTNLEKSFRIVQKPKNDEKIIEEVGIFAKLNVFRKTQIYSHESLDYDDKLISDDYNTISKCNENYNKYKNYAKNIKKININQLHECDIYIKDMNHCSNKKIECYCDQIIMSIKKIHELGNKNQSLDEPYLSQINTDVNLETNDAFSDILIIGYSETGIKLLNEIDYNLGKRMPNSSFRINMFNVTNNKIRTIPETKICQFDDQIIIQTKLTEENQMIQFINECDDSNIGCINLKCTFVEQPKIYLRFSHPIRIENNSIYIKGEIDNVFSIDIFSDSSSLYYILILDENNSEFTRNQIEDKIINISDTNDKILFEFKKAGKFKGRISIEFPCINFKLSAIIDIDVTNENPTFMYLLDFEKSKKCKQRVYLNTPSFIAIKSPEIPQCSNNIDIDKKVHNKEYLHLAYVKNHSNIKILGNNIEFAFRRIYFKIEFNKIFTPQLSQFDINYPQRCSGCFEYYNNKITMDISEDLQNQSIVQLRYEHGKLKNLQFKSRIFSKNEYCNYHKNGIIYRKDDIYNNKLNMLLDQIEEQQNKKFDLSHDFIIPWLNIILLFDKTKEEIHELMLNKVYNDYALKDTETYYIAVKKNQMKPIEKIPDEILANKKIVSRIRNKMDVKTEKFDHLKTLDFNDLFEILNNLNDLKLGLQLFRQIYEYNKEIALNIFKTYHVLHSLDENYIMHNTLSEIINIGNILFNDHTKKETIEEIFDINRVKSKIIVTFKNNQLSNFIYDGLSSSVYGQVPKNIKDNDTNDQSKLIKYHEITEEEIIKSDDFNNLYEILTRKEPSKNIKPKTTEVYKEEIIDEFEEMVESENFVGHVESVSTKETDESKYPEYAYKISISEDRDLYSISLVEKNNENCFLPKNAVLAEGEIPNLDKYVFNAIERITHSNFSLHIPNQHVTLLVDISQLSGSGYKNELCINMMVTMHLLNAFEIPFSVWVFSCRNLCFCLKKKDEEFDRKRQCLIRDAYFLKRRNPRSYVLSAIDTITRLKEDQKTNLFVIFSTFISPQTLRPYEEWKQKALNCTGNKHIICLLEPYQHKCKNVDERLKETIKESEFIHVIKYSNVCETTKRLMLKIFSLSKNFSKGAESLKIDRLNIKCHKYNNTYKDFDDDIRCYKHPIDIRTIKSKNIGLKKLEKTIITGDFENIDQDMFNNFGDINHFAAIMPSNKATKYVLSSHGSNIDIQGLIKSFFTGFRFLKIFKSKTGNKIREYCADILIDCSNLVKIYSVEHCFISVLSLLFSINELRIPYVNLVFVGKHFVRFLINKKVRNVLNNITILSQLYSLIIEEASESRFVEEGIRQLIEHIMDNKIAHIMFIVTDALFGNEHEEKIKDVLSNAYINMVKVIGIGTGPVPDRIDNIFALSLYSKNPYNLRYALYNLIQISITDNNRLHYPSLITDYPTIQCESNTNEDLLEPFAKTPFNNDQLMKSMNKESLDRKNFKGDFAKESNFDLGANGMFKDYMVLVMMFYEGMPDTNDKNITKHSFVHGPEKDKEHDYISSPADKLSEKGFRYNIVTTYKDAMNELLSGKYSIAIIATCSDGYEGNEQNDSNYLEPFLNTIVNFYCKGGALILFGENPPFIFEVNLILQRLPGINVVFDENEFEEGGKIMKASDSKDGNIGAGYFLGPEFTFDAEINGSMHKDICSIGAGILELGEGKTLAVFKTTDGAKIEDSFRIFSKTSSGKPSCIFKVPKGKEGVLFVDNGASKLFNDYIEDGAPRLVSNLSIGCIYYSHFRESHLNNLEKEAIKIEMSEEEIGSKPTILMKKRPPLLITLLLDATDSMQPHIDNCKQYLAQLVEETMNKVKQLKIYFQIVAYRDFSEGERMVEPYPITDSLEEAVKDIARVKAFGGVDPNENISAGFETALKQIDEFKITEPNAKNIFILIADSPNHDEDIKYVDGKDVYYASDIYIHENKDGVPWKDVWLHIDEKMKEVCINKLVCISVNDKFDDFSKYQYDNWKKYGCNHINKIVKPYTIKTNSFHEIFVNNISDEMKFMYKFSFNGGKE